MGPAGKEAAPRRIENDSAPRECTKGGDMTRVVVAYDDCELRELLAESLTELGHQVVGMGNRDDAWHLLDAAPSGVVALLDVARPCSHGLDVLHKLVADPPVPARHGFIMLTTIPLTHTRLLPGYILSDLPAHIVELEMPFDLDALESAVESAATKCMIEART
jgi:CheY-like chemotaxis protein